MAEPDKLTPAELIESARKARRSLMLLVEAIERGDLTATPHEITPAPGGGGGPDVRAGREGWALHFADLDIDTSTPAGEMEANIIISGSQYERRLISQRTRDALAAKRARGERLVERQALPLEITRRIVTERGEGRTFQAIADALMADGIPTARGKTR